MGHTLHDLGSCLPYEQLPEFLQPHPVQQVAQRVIQKCLSKQLSNLFIFSDRTWGSTSLTLELILPLGVCIQGMILEVCELAFFRVNANVIPILIQQHSQ